jgi:hypothetical protein
MSRERLQVPFVPKNNHTVAVTLEEGVLAQVAAFAERIEIANRQRKRRNVQGLTAKGRESLALRIRGLSGEAARSTSGSRRSGSRTSGGTGRTCCASTPSRPTSRTARSLSHRGIGWT